jgi:hypothetical protein
MSARGGAAGAVTLRSGARRRVGARVVVSALALVVAATGCQSPQKKVAEQLKAVDSWAATAGLTGQSWLDGTTPAVYARQTLEAATQAMQRSAQTIAQAPLRADLRSDLAAAVRARQSAVEMMRSGVEAGDRGVVAGQVRRLAEYGRGLSGLAQRMAGS